MPNWKKYNQKKKLFNRGEIGREEFTFKNTGRLTFHYLHDLHKLKNQDQYQDIVVPEWTLAPGLDVINHIKQNLFIFTLKMLMCSTMCNFWRKNPYNSLYRSLQCLSYVINQNQQDPHYYIPSVILPDGFTICLSHYLFSQLNDTQKANFKYQLNRSLGGCDNLREYIEHYTLDNDNNDNQNEEYVNIYESICNTFMHIIMTHSLGHNINFILKDLCKYFEEKLGLEDTALYQYMNNMVYITPSRFNRIQDEKRRLAVHSQEEGLLESELYRRRARTENKNMIIQYVNYTAGHRKLATIQRRLAGHSVNQYLQYMSQYCKDIILDYMR